MGHNLILHQILNFLHRGGPLQLFTGQGHRLGNAGDLHGGHSPPLVDALIGLGDGRDNFAQIKIHFRTVALNNSHTLPCTFFLHSLDSYRFIWYI